MSSKINLAILGIRISAILYYLIILGCIVSMFFVSGVELILPICMIIFTVPLVVFLEILIVHLRGRKFWAWIAGLVIAALYVPSLFLPLGVMILLGLCPDESRKEFEAKNQ